MKLNIPKMNFGRDIKKMMNNKMVLYIVLFITVSNVLGYLMVDNIDAVILLFLVGLLTSHFSKNMIVVMLTAILFTNLLVGSKRVSRTPLLEGMKEGLNKDNKDHKDNKDKKEKYVNLKPLKPSSTNEDDASDDDLDFPGSLEAAYDNLDKLLSSDAINKMSADTQKLADKQHNLMGNIDKLEQLMKNAEKMMQGLNGGKIDKLIKQYTK